MEKAVLNEVYEYLKRIKAVDTESEFSTGWLCRSEGYMRGLRFRQAQPGMGTLAICASKLLHYSNKLRDKQTHSNISDRLLQLSESCNQQINAASEAQWMEEA